MSINKKSVIWLTPKETIIKWYESSTTIKKLLACFNLKSGGGNNKRIIARLKYEKLDCSKFKQNFNAREIESLIPLKNVLVENSTYNRKSLKKRLIKAGILELKCYAENCNITTHWNGKPLTLQLDHKNGKNNDNRVENLRLLCPNCHSQTDTYAGKGKVNNTCSNCNNLIIKKRKYCNYCKIKNIHFRKNVPNFNKRKVIRPSKEELFKLIWERPTISIARHYGVSDKAVEKWSKTYNIPKPPRGYWQKPKNQQKEIKNKLLEKGSNFY